MAKACAVVLALTCGLVAPAAVGHAQPTPAATSAGSSDPVPELNRAGWSKDTYRALTELIAAKAGTGAVVTFDFDNTTQARDVGDAVVGQTDVDGAVTPGSIPPAVVPPLRVDGRTVRISDGLSAYYEALGSVNAATNPFNLYPSHNMVAQYFTGRTLADFVRQVRRAYADGAGEREIRTGRERLVGGFGRPFVYRQMADLYGNLRAHGYDVWVVSAGITWAVRWMVRHNLNPLIRKKYGRAAELPLDQVVGISMLLRDTRTGRTLTDYTLSHGRPDRAYLKLQRKRTRHLEITALPDFLQPWRGGKVGVIQNLITRERPYLAGGDSQGDFEMLNAAENRLFITRLDKPDIQEELAEQLTIDQPGRWMLQPTISSAPVGFLPNACVLRKRVADDPDVRKKAAQSLRLLAPSGTLDGFAEC